ncbi:MAG TPA: alanine racemase [Candidatus Dormibacteraeota bacterium]
MSSRWAEVDLGAIAHNLRHLQSLQEPGTRVLAVVKANAYGHGARAVARAALDAGAWGLAVSTLEEAGELRDLCPPERILAMGGLLPGDAGFAAATGVAVTCFSLDVARALAAAAQERGVAVPVHLKVDTGMGRLGVQPEAALELARFVAGAGSLRLAGVFTHFAASDTDPEFTAQQADRFRRLLGQLEEAGINPGLRHAGNTGGALRGVSFDAVRLGIGLYGCEAPGTKPALQLRALLVQVKTVEPGESVGYGRTWRAERATPVATVTLGYADGVFRARGNRGDVLVRGRRARLIGRVSMDMVTLDVSGIPDVRPGDVATFIGADGEERITAEAVAEWSDTISYEVLTAIGRRVERRYPLAE